MSRVTLREYAERIVLETNERIRALSELTEAKFVTYRTLIDSQAEKVKLALEAADKAIEKQEKTTNERLHLLNELRSGVATREQVESLERRIDDMKERIDKSEGRGAGQAVLITGAIAIAGVVVAIILGFNN